jgi:hypothetical protein
MILASTQETWPIKKVSSVLIHGETDYIVLVCSIFTNDFRRFCFCNTSMLKGM